MIAMDHLADRDLNILVDKHIFGQVEMYAGRCDYQCLLGSRAFYRCSVCGAVVERTIAQRLLGEAMAHVRSVPYYTESKATAQAVVEAIHNAPVATQIGYIFALRAYLPPEMPLIPWLIFGVSPRHMALAALRAIGVIDEEGCVLEETGSIGPEKAH